MDCSQPGSTVQGILQARILEWTAISFSRYNDHIMKLHEKWFSLVLHRLKTHTEKPRDRWGQMRGGLKALPHNQLLSSASSANMCYLKLCLSWCYSQRTCLSPNYNQNRLLFLHVLFHPWDILLPHWLSLSFDSFSLFIGTHPQSKISASRFCTYFTCCWKDSVTVNWTHLIFHI